MKINNNNYLRKIGNIFLGSFIFLSTCLVAPQFEVNAVNTDINKNLIFNVGGNTDFEPSNGDDGNNKDDWKGHYIYWGSDTNLKWQILDTDSTYYTSTPGLLILSGNLGQTKFSELTGFSYYDEDSVIKPYIDSTIENLLHESEEKAVLKSTNIFKTVGYWDDEEVVIDRGNGIEFTFYEVQFKDYNYFAPTVKMLMKAEYGFSEAIEDAARGTNMPKLNATLLDPYWTSALEVVNSGYKNAVHLYYTTSFSNAPIDKEKPSRAALNIDTDSIFFMTDATVPKPDTFSTIGDTTSKEWQLTLKDDDQKVSISNIKRRTDTRYTFNYTTEGNGNTISAFIKNEDGEVVYYGKVADVDATKSGRGTFYLPGEFISNQYTLHMFSEQRNGEKKTDFAGDVTQMNNLPTEITPDGIFNFMETDGIESREYIDYDLDRTFTEPTISSTYSKNGQSYRFDKWLITPEDAVVNNVVKKSLEATAEYIKTYTVTQQDEDGNNGVTHVVDINTDLTASVDNGGIGLVEPTKEGYVFAGWEYDVPEADVSNVTKDFIFKPKFDGNNEFPIEENKDWVSGSNEDLSIKSDGDLLNLIKVMIDDVLVDANNYTVKSGSTIVEFKASYLNTLLVGVHKLDIVFTNGYSTTEFEIKKKESPVVPPTNSSNTGTSSEAKKLIKVVKAIDGVKDNSTFTKNEIDIIISAKDAYKKLMAEGNPYRLTTKEIKTVKNYDSIITKFYNKLILSGFVSGKGWIDLGNGDWNYYNEDGSTSTKWIAAGTHWYYVKDGRMLRNAWIAQDATGYIWYYVDNEGKMVVNTTIDTYSINANGEWYNQ